MRNDGIARGTVKSLVIRPQDRPRRHGIDPHLGRQLDRQRARQAKQAGLCRAVQGVGRERSFGMDVGDIDHRTTCCTQVRCSGLRQKQRRLEIGADQVVPRRQIDLAERCRKKTRGIIHQCVEPPETGNGCRHQQRQLRYIEQVGLQTRRRCGPQRIEFTDQRLGVRCCRPVVQHDVGTRRVQLARDRTADPLCRTRYQYRFAIHGPLLNFKTRKTRSWILTFFSEGDRI